MAKREKHETEVADKTSASQARGQEGQAANDTLQNKSSFRYKLVSYSQACDTAVRQCFGRLGQSLHDHRWRHLLIPLILMMPCIAGLTQLSANFQDDPRRLYVPEDTQAARDAEKVVSHFGLDNLVANVYGVTAQEGSNMLTTENMLTLYDTWDNISAFNTTFEGETYTLFGVCAKLGNVCQKSTLLAFWNYNRSAIADQSNSELWDTIVNAGYVAIEQDGREVNLSTVAYVSVDKVLSTKFTILLEQKHDDDGDLQDKRTREWEITLGPLVRDHQWGELKFFADTVAELREEGTSPMLNELVLLPIGYFLLIVYATIALSRNSKVHSHGSLAWVSFVAVLIAILAAYGLGLWFRIPFSSVIFTLSFLLLGIGMDDTFVIVAAFQDEEVVHLPPRERVAEAMSRAGSSIALTSMTDLCAFLAGSYCSIPVVRSFCQYAAIGVTLDFFLQTTSFASVMYMSACREEKDRLDWLCCLLAKNPGKQCVGTREFNKEQPEVISVFLEKYYTPALLSSWGKCLGVFIGSFLLGLNIWASTMVTVDFQYEWLVLDSSYVSDMFDVRDRYWGYREVPVGIYTFQGNYSTELTQVQFSQMTEALDANTMLVLGSCVNWWPAFIDFAESNATSSMKTVDSFRIVNSNRFDTTLRNFYNDDAGEPYRPLLHLSHDDVLQMSEITCIEDANENTMTYYIEQMNRLRDTANICSSVGAIALSYNYWLRDAHVIFMREIAINLACALLGVFFVTTIMLGSLGPSLLVSLMLVIVDVEVLGSIYLSGFTFNIVTGINLVLAVGLAVDAVVHIVHSFLSHDGTPEDRAKIAVSTMGRTVLNGTISTLVVLLPLFFAQSYPFRVFFSLFMAIIGYSAFNGIVVLPVLLALFNPASHNSLRGKLQPGPVVANHVTMANGPNRLSISSV